MPALTNLYSQVKSDPQWKNSYKRNISFSRQVSKNMPLVHVLRRARNTRLIQIFLRYSYYELETSSPTRSSPKTLVSENFCTFPPSLYFYAGRAAPGKRYGYLALAFDKSCESKHQRTALPFDSGGLVHGYISTNLPNDPALKKFVADSLMSRHRWRPGFARYLAAYFLSPSHYYTGRPVRPDPEELHVRNSDWRSWTFEIQMHDNQKIDECIKWHASGGLMNGIRPIVLSLSPSDPLHSFMRRAIIHGKRAKPIREMERWIRNQLRV